MTLPRRICQDLLCALGLLSRLPLPAHDGRGAQASWSYPIAGAMLGALSGGAGILSLGIGLSPNGAALCSLAVAVMLTGALHEDGLADSADGLWGSHLRARRLEIMKDSRTGTYGVIALVLGLLARWIGLSILFEGENAWISVIGTAALSRAAMPALMATLPHARLNGLSHAVGLVPRSCAIIAAAIGVVFAYGCFGWDGTTAIAATAFATVIIARIALAKIGGQTGDILGATQQIAEISILFAITS